MQAGMKMILVSVSLVVANSAYAVCNPACGKNETCRYNGTTGNYYCESNTSSVGKKR